MPATLAGHLAMVPDPRVERTKRHRLGDILTVAVCAVLCGYGSYYDMAEFCSEYLEWLRKWIALDGGVPSHDTFRRVLGMVEPGHFQSVFALWTEAVSGGAPDGQVAIDGKALRGSADGSGGVQYIVNAWSARRHMVLGQARVRGKANETVAIPELLPRLGLSGSLVSIDAIGCQKAIAARSGTGAGTTCWP